MFKQLNELKEKINEPMMSQARSPRLASNSTNKQINKQLIIINDERQ